MASTARRGVRRSAAGRVVALVAVAAGALCLTSQAFVQAPAEAAPPARRALLAGLLSLPFAPLSAQAAPGKVVVLGGSGFIGSRICEALVAQGAPVVSVSRSGSPPEGAGAWAQKVTWKKADVLAPGLAQELSGAEAVVSAIGSLGSVDDETNNGATNEAAVAAAKAANAKRFVLVSASPDVFEANIGGLFTAYIAGKKRAEAAVAGFPGDTLVLQPSFVYGGDSFSANPPRVAQGYGALVETVLGSPPLRLAAGISPAALRLALSPPIAVADIAAAATAGALGKVKGTFAGHDAIQGVAQGQGA